MLINVQVFKKKISSTLCCKDKIIFVTKEDHATPSNAELVEEDPNDPYEEQGLILPSGEINWNCPCLGGMASGPCGTDFKEAFSCFHYSKEEVKGSECLDQFRMMQECMQRYPELYPQEDDNVPEENSSKAEPTTEDATPTDAESTLDPVQASDGAQASAGSTIES
ncbi:coiled-coil-helix-coiled-coil-helix domain containing 4b isoform X2 [Syngnathoides biaculeatus]|uniref:coiled-coil-helix-coiled-coil-helix domain containing 4b isoform X2 n=1 Tax=Syngnathoides biaculeatus TaxID=300417 RepID=UPI002ADE261A|nr:coiled-coil-helix-coiled-coil-helix domain containing 4b isoform X2 [Syngnathoides biaculeatus]